MEGFIKPKFINFKPDYKPYNGRSWILSGTYWQCLICYESGIRDRVSHNIEMHGTLYPYSFDPLGVMWEIVSELWGGKPDG